MRNSKSRGKVKSLITTFLHQNASKSKHVVALVLALIYIVQMNNKKPTTKSLPVQRIA